MRRRFGFGKAVMILVFATAFIMLFTFIVMSLWNAILPDVLGVKVISFWQALGILILSKILFSGFGGLRHKGEHFKSRMREKMMARWDQMTPEQREQFKAEMKKRCGNWKNRFDEQNVNTNQPETE
jgi:hypothetical protein